MEWYHIILIVIGSLLLLSVLALLGISFVAFLLYFKRKDDKVKFEDRDLSLTAYKPYEVEIRDAIKFFKEKTPIDVTVKSHDGLKLKGYYYNNNSDTTVVFVHGYGASPFHNFSTVGKRMFLEGYNVFFIIQRAHNESEGKYTTFGIKERRDVQTWLYKINDMFEPKKLILYGLSMGCASSAMALGLELPKNLKVAVLDCGFNDVFSLMMYQTKRRIKINPYLTVRIMNFYAKIFGGFDMREVTSSQALSRTTVPCLFIHGRKDDVVPISHGEENFEACASKKEAIFLDGVDHARCYYAGGIEVEEKVMDFVKNALEEGE